jgi:hypothetical protein
MMSLYHRPIALIRRHARRDHLQRAADAGDGVFTVRDDGGHFTEARAPPAPAEVF